jgi:hypothetical protein
LLLPGLFAIGFVNFGVNPIFQIEKKTAPLVIAAATAVFVSILLVFILPWGQDASNLAIAQAGGYLAALAVTIFFACRAQAIWPSWRDFGLASLGVIFMYIAVSLFSSLTPGFRALVMQILTGGVIYGLFVVIFDIARLRSHAVAWLRPFIAPS